MPLYYFAYAGKAPSEEGEHLTSDAAALAHAEVMADELSRNGEPRPTIIVFGKDRKRIVLGNAEFMQPRRALRPCSTWGL